MVIFGDVFLGIFERDAESVRQFRERDRDATRQLRELQQYQQNLAAQQQSVVWHDFATDRMYARLADGSLRQLTPDQFRVSIMNNDVVQMMGGGGAGGSRRLQRGQRQQAGIGPARVLREYRDENGLFHREDGPAIVTMIADDGSDAGYYAWHGLETTRQAIMKPEKISVFDINSHALASYPDIFRTFVARYIGPHPDDGLQGHERALRDLHAQGLLDVLDCNPRFGELVQMKVRGDEPFTGVIVVNRTPEPDGTFKKYYRRVPPHMYTAQQAVAWTFGLAGEAALDYDPIRES